MRKESVRKTAAREVKSLGTPDSEAIAQRLDSFSYKRKSATTVLTKYDRLRERCQ